jgi:superfamily II DNA/RNA helicase
MPPSIHINDRVYQPDMPERGYGVVRLIEENVLTDEQTCQVQFEWVPRLVAVSERSLQMAPKLAGGQSIASTDLGGVNDLQRRLSAALVMAENSQTAAFIRSFAMPLPHQAYLLEKVLSGKRFGHVVADDVGMGKTIEAGLIIAALRQRNPQARVLVLCPAGVVLQWQDEMDEHFGLAFDIAGRDFKVDRGSNWDSHSLVLASLDTLKQERLRDTLKGIPPFDLVVCDEAHRLTARREFLSNDLYRTVNYRFVEWLTQEHLVSWENHSDGSPRSPRVLLMSATPHQGDDLRFGYLLQLARPDLIDAELAAQPGGALGDTKTLEECLTRTAKKRAVDWSGKPMFLGHETKTLEVPLTATEKTALKRLAQYVQSEMVFEETKGEALVRALAMHTFQKIAASSWAALKAALEKRLGGRPESRSVGEEAASMGQEFAFVGGTPERQALAETLTALENVTTDSKWNTFQELIQPGKGFREPGYRILIFTQYRVTQAWLAERLTLAGERVMQIHGGLSLDERRQQRIAFEAEGTVLISTEAGSEGANLHKQCHLMINYDLPWNPMRLLQRIGRLDRYGQKHKVRVANLKAPESWDTTIALKIEAKLDAVQASMGLVADEDYRAMILGGIHEAIDVPEVMRQSGWGADSKALDVAVDEAVQSLLKRKSSLDSLFLESLGMPENYGQGAPALTSDDFRQAFAWAAAGHDIVLKETRTSDNKFLKGVYHFALPAAFRGGLRPSRECYLVFDREMFASVRGTVLGQARGQEIKPSLAGFGDAVTDWFFRVALQANAGSGCYAIKRLSDTPLEEAWWVVFAARWKGGRDWSGPDLILGYGVNAQGIVLRALSPQQIMTAAKVAESASVSEELVLPDLSPAMSACKGDLRQKPEVQANATSLNLWPLCLIHLSAS